MYIKCWILFAEYLFEDEPYLVPREKLFNMRERKLHSVSDDGTTFEEYLNGKFVSKNVSKCKYSLRSWTPIWLILYFFFFTKTTKNGLQQCFYPIELIRPANIDNDC